MVSSGSGATFSAGGDSGSLIVQDCSANPRAVGLLFAGSSTSTIANPISSALTALNVSMVGGPDFCEPAATSATSTGVLAMTPNSNANSRAIEEATRVKEQHEHSIMSVPGVAGMGVGISTTNPDEVVVKVFVLRDHVENARNQIPGKLNGFNVEIEETDEIRAF